MTVPMPRPALALAALALAVAAIGLPAGLAGAQDLSEAQLTALFQDQIEHIRAATAEPGLGASRGLTLTKIAPAGGDAGQDGGPVSIEAATVAAGNGTKKVLDLGQPASQTASAAPGEAPLLYLALPKDEQVRFQVTFAFDSAAIAPDQAPRLRVVCDAARGANVQQFRIIGHTDAAGDAAYNQKLSTLRAEEVERFFVKDCGIDPAKLQAVGVGEQFPFDAKNPKAGVNRRVEFQALS
ncbi:MAG: OmpA family protein [Amaricoccus sp.]